MIENQAYVPQTDPRAGYRAHKAEIDAAIQKVLENGRYILGKEVEAFEQEFSSYIGVRHGIGVGNGTEALELCLRACEIGPGDLVFTVSHTAVATVTAIELVGATPVLIDIDPVTYTMDPACLERALTHLPAGRAKAVIPVHLYGQPAEMQGIIELAHRYGLVVIEDCAQSHGANLLGRLTGAWGDLAAFSFYPTKNLGALGDGGMVVTNNNALAERVRMLQQYGWRERNISEIPGMNSRLDEIQAAILLVKLQYLDKENEARQKLAQIYHSLLADSRIILPETRLNTRHVFHQYVILSPEREALRVHLKKVGIGTLVHYPVPVHLQPAYRGRLGGFHVLPVTERIAIEILSLPMYPQLSSEQVKHVADEIKAWAMIDVRK
jgi:dTDP-4-amino-4,6-dideoxygalactose transaminase